MNIIASPANSRLNFLWDFQGNDLDDHIRLWRDINSKVESAQWALAAIAASLTTKYGDSDIEKFAQAVGRTPQYIWKMARTHRLTIEKSLYSENLSFSHPCGGDPPPRASASSGSC